MGPLYNNVDATLVANGAANVAYAENKFESFFMFTLLATYTGPHAWEVWCAPKDENAPIGVCRPDLTKETKFQYAATACPGWVQNAAGDWIIQLSSNGGTPAAGAYPVTAGTVHYVRVPQCPGCEYITLKPTGANNAVVHLIANANAR
jgi:hypothetical protein